MRFVSKNGVGVFLKKLKNSAGVATIKIHSVANPLLNRDKILVNSHVLIIDKKSEYYDPKSTLEKPIWECVQVEFQEEFSHFITLQELREHPELQEMLVLKKGQRLSIQPVDKKHFEFLCKQGRAK
jgi:predicted RNA-binding protein with PUA-like domain